MDNIAKTAETHMPKSNPAEKSSSNPTVVETIGKEEEKLDTVMFI